MDKTTERRLRVPSSLIMQSGSDPVPITDMDQWFPFFSKREQTFLENFLFCPLFYEERLSGVCIIIASPSLDMEQPNAELVNIMNAAGMFIYKARQKALEKLSDAVTEPCEAEKLISFCESILGKGLHALLIHIDPMLYIDSLQLDLDRYRLYEDISRILSSLVSGNGSACKTPSGKILIAMESSRPIDGELIHRHILSAVASFISSPPDAASLLCSITMCPDDIEDPAEAVNKLVLDE